MLKECLDVFKKIYEEKGESLILDTYVPAEGAYVLVDRDGAIKEIKELPKQKEPPEDFESFIEKDYLSALIDMNKPIDKKKVIHSNNYYAFWVKKDSIRPDKNGKVKLTQEIIDDYYGLLKAPENKYRKKGLELYEVVEAEIGKPDLEMIEKHKDWIKKNIFTIVEDNHLKDDKSYVKIYFDADREAYQRESRRYVIPNVYNTTDYNMPVGDKIFGLPNDNMGLNAKKPYLENKTRKNTMPYLISTEEVAVQKKFFDYLYNQACLGKSNIYLNEEDGIIALSNNESLKQSFRGYYLRIQKGKEVEVHDFDEITGFEAEIEPIELKQYIPIPEKGATDLIYEKIKKLSDVRTLINGTYFKKMLTSYFFTDAKDIKITDAKVKEELIRCRNGYFNWFFKGDISAVKSFFAESSFVLIKNSIGNNYIPKAIEQFNVREAILKYLKGEEYMEQDNRKLFNRLSDMINGDVTGEIEDDAMFYFAAGQIVKYLLSLNRSSKQYHSIVNPILNVKTTGRLKELMQKLFIKYNYDIEVKRKRFANLYSAFLLYPIENKEVDQCLITAGYLYSSLIYEKKNKNEGEAENE